MESNSLNIGQKIRAIREQQGLSLRALAARCGLSVNAISLIERGETSPTVSSLQLLANTLQVPITNFFEDEQDQTVVFLKPEMRLRTDANDITMESLGIGLRNQQLEPFLITAAPNTGTLEQPISHAGEEFVYCLQGTVEYSVDGRIYSLQPGYSLLFSAALPHCFRSTSQTPAQMLVVFLAVEGGDLARRLHLEPPANQAHNRG